MLDVVERWGQNVSGVDDNEKERLEMRFTTAVAMASAALLMGCGAIRSSKSLRDISGVQRHEAELLISFPIEGRFGAPVEPSGLTFHEGFLYTVSDEHDTSMFRLAMTVDTHVAEADLTLVELPLQFSPGAETKGMDFEGIAADGEGGFYLLSEQYARVLHTTLEDLILHPVGPELLEAGREHGLFTAGNAGLEGIALDGSVLLLCSERRPRAIVEFSLSSPDDPILAVHSSIQTFSKFSEGTDEDFAGIFAEEGAVYVLERNAYAVCKLKRSAGQYRPVASVSYADVIDRHGLRYERKQRETVDYGRGEGLAMDAERIYIVLDNNGRSLKADPEDARARLLVLRRPAGF